MHTIGTRGATIIVDDSVVDSPNLVAGANKAGYHLLNTNVPRDYKPDVVTDIALARVGDASPDQSGELELVRGILVDSARVVIQSLEVEIRELVGQGSRVAALLKLSGRNSGGVAFNEEGHLCSCVFSVVAGRIEEISLFPDTMLIETALYGRRYVPDV